MVHLFLSTSSWETVSVVRVETKPLKVKELLTPACLFIAGTIWHDAPSSYLNDLLSFSPCFVARVCTRCMNE